MKITNESTFVQIECTAEELRQSATLSDCVGNLLRNVFRGPEIRSSVTAEESEEEEDS